MSFDNAKWKNNFRAVVKSGWKHYLDSGFSRWWNGINWFSSSTFYFDKQIYATDFCTIYITPSDEGIIMKDFSTVELLENKKADKENRPMQFLPIKSTVD